MTPELKTKILSATRGTKLGAILRCAMGMNELGVAPRFVGKASVTSDSFIMCDLIDSDGNGHHGAFVGSLADFDRNLLGLSEHLDLSRTDREALMVAATGWIGKDWRSGAAAGRHNDTGISITKKPRLARAGAFLLRCSVKG